MELLIKLWVVSVWLVAGYGYWKGSKSYFSGIHSCIMEAIGYSAIYVLLSVSIIGSIMIVFC